MSNYKELIDTREKREIEHHFRLCMNFISMFSKNPNMDDENADMNEIITYFSSILEGSAKNI